MTITYLRRIGFAACGQEQRITNRGESRDLTGSQQENGGQETSTATTGAIRLEKGQGTTAELQRPRCGKVHATDDLPERLGLSLLCDPDQVRIPLPKDLPKKPNSLEITTKPNEPVGIPEARVTAGPGRNTIPAAWHPVVSADGIPGYESTANTTHRNRRHLGSPLTLYHPNVAIPTPMARRLTARPPSVT